MLKRKTHPMPLLVMIAGLGITWILEPMHAPNRAGTPRAAGASGRVHADGGGSQVRIWRTENPLFDELLSDQPRRLPGEAGFFWTHPLQADSIRPMAIQYGVEYSLSETGEAFRRINLHPAQDYTMVERLAAGEIGEIYPQAKALCRLNWYRARGEGMPAVNEAGQTFLFAPKNREAYLRDAERTLRECGDRIWGVYTADELLLKQRKAILSLFEHKPDDHPYLGDVDAAVREQFGLRKYGLPVNSEDPEPYRWLAMNRWLDAEACLLMKDLREIVDRVAPHVKIVSDDPVSGFHPYDFALRGTYCDVLTHQIYPNLRQDRQEFTFFSKLLADLSGKSVWPCAHLENYGVSYSAEEVVEVLSQVFRGGGEGLHYYPLDVRGNRRGTWDTRYCRIGAPDRWNALYATLERIEELPRLKEPQGSRAAILIEPSSHFALLPPDVSEHFEYAACAHLVGPHARSWYRFVHGGQLKRDEVNLSDFRIVYLPMAKFFESDAALEVIQFVRNGGTLICSDPEVFTYAADRDYEPPEEGRELGWVAVDSAEQKEFRIIDNALFRAFRVGDVIRLSPPVKAVKAVLGDGWGVAAEFPDGSPAIAVKRVGEGDWVQFAFQPFQASALSNPGLIKMFRSFQETAGEPVDVDMWRFRFPIPEPLDDETLGACLTGNAIRWRQNVPQPVGGDGVDGIISWSVPPEGVVPGNVSLSSSRLCDRHQAVHAKNVRDLAKARRAWAYTWPAPEALDLEIALAEERELREVRLWFSGALPPLEIATFDGAGTRSAQAAHAGRGAGDDVLLASIPLDGAKAQSIQVRFSARPPGESLILAEMEVWTR